MRNNPPIPTWLVVCCVAMLALALFVGPLAATLAQTPTPEPSYEELLELLRAAPPREAISHEGFWRWKKRVEETLQRV